MLAGKVHPSAKSCVLAQERGKNPNPRPPGYEFGCYLELSRPPNRARQLALRSPVRRSPAYSDLARHGLYFAWFLLSDALGSRCSATVVCGSTQSPPGEANEDGATKNARRTCSILVARSRADTVATADLTGPGNITATTIYSWPTEAGLGRRSTAAIKTATCDSRNQSHRPRTACV